MKLLKVIGLILLIFKASIGMSMPLLSNSDASCCSEISVSDACSSDQDDEEEKGCCSTSVCDCLCCGHIFTLTKAHLGVHHDVQAPQSNNFVFTFDYSFKSIAGIWQPPRSY